MATLKPSPADAEQAIRAIAQQLAKYINARDIDKLLSLFARDGRIFANYQPAAEGVNVLRQHYHQSFSEYDPRDLEVETTQVEVSGDLAFSFGTFAMNLRTASGKRLNDRGKWVLMFRREGGAWLIVGHCYTTDLPITTLAGL